jgi:hypothetical protein
MLLLRKPATYIGKWLPGVTGGAACVAEVIVNDNNVTKTAVNTTLSFARDFITPPKRECGWAAHRAS